MQHLKRHFSNIDIQVINLRDRKEKRKYIASHLERKGLSFKLYQPEKNANPKRGCLESHYQIIKKAYDEKKADTLIIFEDDAMFIKSLDQMKKPPTDWDMIYLGGTVHRVLDRSKSNPGYARVQTWTTHAYVLNMKNREFIEEVLKVWDYQEEVDRYYLEKINPKYKCYMVDPMICIQKGGWSDIENREVNYDFMTQTLNGLRTPEHTTDSEGNYVLRLDPIDDKDLPTVSIITPTYKRRKMFSMALRNFDEFIYPKSKLEWIIVDDSPVNDEKDESVEDMLPRDKRIKYIKLEADDKPFTIAFKRNIGVSNAKNDYIVHMDDDDYYPPESILARIKVLLKYKSQGIECVGSTLIGTYNLLDNVSSMSSDGPISLSEASMAYTKKFWEERAFDEMCERGEHKAFTEQRLGKIIDMPYSFILIAINHKTNFTDSLRANNGGVLQFTEQSGKAGSSANFFDTWDLETQMFIIDLQHYIRKET